MAFETDKFSNFGPVHLINPKSLIDWNNENHQRSIVASLVKGVYVQECDRMQKRKGHRALASPWWESFGFKLDRVLKDVDRSIFGAIYEFKFVANSPKNNYLGEKPPRYVIAFRGVAKTLPTCEQDCKLSVKYFFNKLHKDYRPREAIKAVQEKVDKAGASNVWLAGHSLGSAIAMLAGKNMVVKKGFILCTYLFNPIYMSPIELIEKKRFKKVARFLNSLIKVVLADAVGEQVEQHQFRTFAPWVPHLFVNQSDPICSGYIGYFESREKSGKFGRIATQISLVTLLLKTLRIDSEPFRLLPSAYLHTNQRSTENFLEHHGIQQWWKQNFCGHSELYKFHGAN